MREARRESPPDRGKVAQEIARRKEQVCIRERPVARTPRGEVLERGAQDGVDPLVQRKLPLGEGGLDDALAKRLEFVDDTLADRAIAPGELRFSLRGLPKSSEKASETSRRLVLGELAE